MLVFSHQKIFYRSQYAGIGEWEQKIGLFGPLLQIPSARIEIL